ncbi:MAG: UDP-N-acetylmuramate dehydrogenase [Candidatus Fimenecus sp.]
MFEKILAAADRFQTEYFRDFPLSKVTSFQTGGNADLLLLPNSTEALSELIRACNASDVPYFVIGNGSNLLVSDKGVRGAVLRLAAPMSEITYLGDGQICCAAGAPLTALCNFAYKHSLSGLEFAYGIPGSAGGAAYMNAGAYGGEMKDVLTKCTHIAPDGTVGSFSGTDLQLGYRRSVYAGKNYCITALYLQLSPGDPAAIKAAMDDKMARRVAKQPLEYPSAGSTFKRPEGYFAGALIEECGLKGYSIGGAQVSEKHAGFVINKGGATTADILALIRHIQETVLREKGVHLQTEVEVIGEV